MSRGLPNPDKHWLIPGAAPEGGITHVWGKVAAGKTMLACELAASVMTYTPFFGSVKPWLAARVAFFAYDDYGASNFLHWLLRGRTGSPAFNDDMLIFYPEWAWDRIELQLKNNRVKVAIFDDLCLWAKEMHDTTPSAAYLLIERLRKAGITVLTTNQLTRGGQFPASPHAAELNPGMIGNSTLLVSKDTAQDTIIVDDVNVASGPMLRAHPVFEDGDSLRFDPLPLVALNKLELDVWLALFRLEHGTATDVCRVMKVDSKSTLVLDALRSMLEAGAVEKHEQTLPPRMISKTRADLVHRTREVWRAVAYKRDSDED